MRATGVDILVKLAFLAGHNLISPTLVFGQTSTNPCPVCPEDGVVSDPDIGPSQPGLTLSCFQLEASAGALEDGTADCELLQVSALQAGCCLESCTLCPRGGNESTIFNSDQEIPKYDSTSPNVTCGDLASNPPIQFLQAITDAKSKECNDSQLRRSARWCQCDGMQVECSLCSNGQNPATAEFLDDIVHPLTGISCQYYAYQMSLWSEAECPSISNSFDLDVSALCCGTPAPNICSICGANGTILEGSSSTTISTSAYGDITCGVAQAAAVLIANDQACTGFLDTIGGDVVSSCCQLPGEGENAAPQSAACVLSCNGELPRDMSRTDPVSGHSCQSLSQAYTQLSSEECDSAAQILEFDAESFCCDTIKPPSTCSICDDDIEELMSPRQEQNSEKIMKVVTYPEQILFHFEGHTCGLVQRSASFIVGEKACRALKDTSRATRSCRCRPQTQPEPSSAPRGDPTEAETPSGSSHVLVWQSCLWLTPLIVTITLTIKA